MLKTKSPKQLWDECLEYEQGVHSNTAHDLFELDGEVPETIVSGKTAIITRYSEFGWYDWIYFLDTEVKTLKTNGSWDKLFVQRY